MSTRTRTTQKPQGMPASQPQAVPIPPAALLRLRNLWQTANTAATRFQEVAAAVAETLPLPPGQVRIDIQEGIAYLEPEGAAQEAQE